MPNKNVHTALCLGDFVYVITEVKVGKKQKKTKYVKNIGYIVGKDSTQGTYTVITVASSTNNDSVNVKPENLLAIPVTQVKQALYETECDTPYDVYLPFVNKYNGFQYKAFDIPAPVPQELETETV